MAVSLQSQKEAETASWEEKDEVLAQEKDWHTLAYLTIRILWFWAVFVLVVCTGIAYVRWMAEIP